MKKERKKKVVKRQGKHTYLRFEKTPLAAIFARGKKKGTIVYICVLCKNFTPQDVIDNQANNSNKGIIDALRSTDKSYIQVVRFRQLCPVGNPTRTVYQ